jgi:hypothetical protein
MDLLHILVDQVRDADVADIQFILRNQKQEKVERAFECFQLAA